MVILILQTVVVQNGDVIRAADIGLSADVSERLIHRSYFRLALVLLKIRLQLLLGFDGVSDEPTRRAKGQFADVAVCRAGSASDEAHDNEFAVRHRDIMAGVIIGVKCFRQELAALEASLGTFALTYTTRTSVPKWPSQRVTFSNLSVPVPTACSRCRSPVRKPGSGACA